MKKTIQTKLQYKRAIALFLLGYIGIAALGAGMALLLGALTGSPPSISTHNPSYSIYENFLVLLNLIGWVLLSLLYFRSRIKKPNWRGEPLALGIFWLAMAAILDYVLFVFVQSPLYISAHDFYMGQFPWIYIIYVIVAISPLCSAMSGKAFSKKPIASHN